MLCRGLVSNLSTSRRKITPGLRCCTSGFVINLKATNALGVRCLQVLANEVIAGFDAAFWHFASFAAPHHFGRYWSRSGHRLALGSEVSVAMTQLRHRQHFHAAAANPVSAPIKVLI